ncbi:C-C motif chemokine 20-like isoform X2 [Dendrobates tinctorius]|uniref:C-C motif chemokine 20-like isoform X1 n=1 Tax=Dendrobates tinctorius TaxID=92724 RepID=UPI003CCA17B9
MKTLWTLIIPGLLLCHLVCLQGAGVPVTDCCLQTRVKKIPFGAIIGYEIQAKDTGCPIEAVVFLTNTNPVKKLCATPGISWVKKWIIKLDKRKKDAQKKENKPKKSVKHQLE